MEKLSEFRLPVHSVVVVVLLDPLYNYCLPEVTTITITTTTTAIQSTIITIYYKINFFNLF